MTRTFKTFQTPAVLFIGCASLLSSLRAEAVSTEVIAETWSTYGQGVVRHQNRMLFLQEAEGSKGVGVMSPDAYGENVVLRFDVMPMNPASVCVAILSASNQKGGALVIPAGYDGSLGLWTRDTDNYFFAFHNMAHDRTPFLVRFPEGGQLAEHEKNVMQAGVFYRVEVGRAGGKLWMTVDGKKLFENNDAHPLAGGHAGFRIRGINGMAAACLIRNVSIEEK